MLCMMTKIVSFKVEITGEKAYIKQREMLIVKLSLLFWQQLL